MIDQEPAYLQLEIQLTAPAMPFRFIEKARAPHWG
jgi:hypothetical protein